ncbi:MAG: serine O-acetyltransferase [Alphaproteobacteria bacterium]|nr:serine O-acetyltransferase [Alphaproteobacteria bacterium]
MKNDPAPQEIACAETLWPALRAEAEKLVRDEALAPLLQSVILQSDRLAAATGRLLAGKLAAPHLPEGLLLELYAETESALPELGDIVTADLCTVTKNDPAAKDWVAPFLFFKGFHALQAARVAHYLWSADRRHLALYLQNRISDVFAVDIHPAARIGRGVMLDHATGIVIGETAVVEDDVLLWHGVTLGGRNFTDTDRHPKVRKGASIGASATVLGNIEVGAGSKVAAGSMVLENVPPGKTVAGVPARVVG